MPHVKCWYEVSSFWHFPRPYSSRNIRFVYTFLPKCAFLFTFVKQFYLSISYNCLTSNISEKPEFIKMCIWYRQTYTWCRYKCFWAHNSNFNLWRAGSCTFDKCNGTAPTHPHSFIQYTSPYWRYWATYHQLIHELSGLLAHWFCTKHWSYRGVNVFSTGHKTSKWLLQSLKTTSGLLQQTCDWEKGRGASFFCVVTCSVQYCLLQRFPILAIPCFRCSVKIQSVYCNMYSEESSFPVQRNSFFLLLFLLK